MFLREHFGKSGARYYNIARGIDHREVQPDRPRKSVGAEDTFMVDIIDLGVARAELRPLAAKVWRHCESKGLHGRTVTLKVKYADFETPDSLPDIPERPIEEPVPNVNGN